MTKHQLALMASTALLICGGCTWTDQRTEASANGTAGVAAEDAAAVVNAAGQETPLFSEVAPQARPPEGVRFDSVLALNQNPPPGQPQLRGGAVARSSEWPASLYAVFDVGGGRRAACTAALVGPRAILTAAHCVPPSGAISIRFGGADYMAICSIHSRYRNGSDDSADFALCKAERVVSVPAGFRFETISLDPMDQLARQRIVLGGYGCISDVAADGRTDGLYRIGYNSVDETSNSQTRNRGAGYYAPQQVNNLLTAEGPNVANLCPGDSGGPAFRASSTATGAFASRRIVGVNSRVFYRDPSRTSYGASLVSATGGPDFGSWASKWARDNGVAACGIRGGLPNCRS